MAELAEAADKAGAAVRLAEAAAEDVAEVVHNHINWMWGGGVIGLGIGLGTGYFIAQTRLEEKYKKVAEDEIDQMREHFRERTVARERKPDLGDLNKRLDAMSNDLGYSRPTKPPVPVTPLAPPAPGEPNVSADDIKNVFETRDGWDWEIERAQRQNQDIYIIHRDEYGESDAEQTTLSYYGGDDVLCDENDHIVDNQVRLVGNCLDRFGHGSGDRNVVYVRNELLDIDLEVVKSDKTYAEEVHGFKHEDPPRRIPRHRGHPN
jgi:hypothetical protein